MTYSPPVVGFSITSGYYAPRSYGIHAATDYGCPIGTPVHAIGDGVVKERTTAVDAGRYISLDHPDGLRSRYLHLSQWKVVVGQPVSKGQVVGVSGNTGTATYGPHLHHDCSFKTLAEARQIQPDPVQHLNRWRVNPEVLFSLQEDDMNHVYIVRATDGAQPRPQFTYNPLTDKVTALSAMGLKVIGDAQRDGLVTVSHTDMTRADITSIGVVA